MKRALVIALAVLVAVALTTRDLWEEPVLGFLGLSSDHEHYLGYVEGETSLVAPPVAGRLVERPVNRGDSVKKGDRLFVIDTTLAAAEVARSEAALAEARARHENLLTGKRPDELAVTVAQRREAEAALELAEGELRRQIDLLARGVTTRQNHDQAQSQVSQLKARVASLLAQERANELAARAPEIVAAVALIGQTEANLAQARKKLEDLAPTAPENALVENTFYNLGEWVGAGAPVVSLLPPGRVKLRFFVPEEDVSQALPGKSVAFTCDGCPRDLRATISYVSPRAEFTPPVIYSQTARSKLVFLVEARPQSDAVAAAPLSPGVPISVARFAPSK
jgi:HlyD family secretion protein